MIEGPVRTVVVDAGHGGEDPGASYFGMQEKVFALDLARRLKAALELAGARVLMTREDDRLIALNDRAGVANHAIADAFVSIHLNANKRPWVSGIEVYHARESEVAANAQWPPHIDRRDIVYSATTIRQLAWDLVLRQGRVAGASLAAHVCGAMEQSMNASCAQKQARFVVLRESWVAAVLVEVGYLSNFNEAQKLGDAAYREQLAQAISSGVLSYLRSLPRESEDEWGATADRGV